MCVHVRRSAFMLGFIYVLCLDYQYCDMGEKMYFSCLDLVCVMVWGIKQTVRPRRLSTVS